MTLDIEGVLRDHVIHGGSSGGRWNADCLAVDCHWSAHGDTGGFAATMDAHRAHVAAVLREQIAAWLADFPWTETARDDLLAALAAQVAPSRVPGEGS